MEKLVHKIFGKPISRDKGVRGTSSGKLYIDKKVFFRRPDVKKIIEDIYNSDVVKSQIKRAKSV